MGVHRGRLGPVLAAILACSALLTIGHVALESAGPTVAAPPPGATLSEPDPLAAQPDAPILAIDGAVINLNGDGVARLDRRQLEALGMRELVTSNPFVDGVHRFAGVLLSDVLDLVGADGTTIMARALDGYTVQIPVQDARAYPVMLALERDGERMTVRNKGPIWIIYPIDQYDELDTEEFSARSIWQLSRLTVR